MIPAERLRRIAAHLESHDVLAVDEACRLLGASPATIRRDFAELVAAGRAERHHGGVGRLRRDALAMVPLAARAVQHPAEKQAIAACAAGLLDSGQAVFVDGGTSTLQLADHLGAVPLRIITNSLRLAAALGAATYAAPIEVHLTGGYLLSRGGLLIGPQARQGIVAYHADWAFLSVGGIGEDGVFNTDELVQDLEREMIAHADRVAVLADRSKLGRRSLCRVCGLDAIDVLITDTGADQGQVAAIRRAGVQVELAGARQPEPAGPPAQRGK